MEGEAGQFKHTFPSEDNRDGASSKEVKLLEVKQGIKPNTKQAKSKLAPVNQDQNSSEQEK